MEIEYTIDFNINKRENKKNEPAKETNKPEIERKCPKCGENKMSYATLQLRSADEGQTVFYTCTSCGLVTKSKFKTISYSANGNVTFVYRFNETENS